MTRRTQQTVAAVALAALLAAGMTACAADDEQPAGCSYELDIDHPEPKSKPKTSKPKPKAPAYKAPSSTRKKSR